ncbi:hypothetical protein ACS0TY_007825 [Phlomoides rotata]
MEMEMEMKIKMGENFEIQILNFRGRGSAAAVREAPISGLVLQIAIPPSSHRIDSLWVGSLNLRLGGGGSGCGGFRFAVCWNGRLQWWLERAGSCFSCCRGAWVASCVAAGASVVVSLAAGATAVESVAVVGSVLVLFGKLPCCCQAAVVASWCPQICTIPLDTAKVRLQLQKKVVAGDAMSLPKYKGLLGTVGTIARVEGMASLWKGIVPGLHRQFLFGGLRIGLYEPLKTSTWGKNHVGDVSLSKKIFAALTTGALGIAIANPTDLVKVRLQAKGKLPQGMPRRYSGALNAYSTIVRQEGVAKLWTGLGPNVARNAIINAAELASYDQVKEQQECYFFRALSSCGAIITVPHRSCSRGRMVSTLVEVCHKPTSI